MFLIMASLLYSQIFQMEPESTFAKPKRGRYILCIVVGLVIVLLVAAVVVLTILLVRDKSDGDDGGQRQVYNKKDITFYFINYFHLTRRSASSAIRRGRRLIICLMSLAPFVSVWCFTVSVKPISSSFIVVAVMEPKP